MTSMRALLVGAPVSTGADGPSPSRAGWHDRGRPRLPRRSRRQGGPGTCRALAVECRRSINIHGGGPDRESRTSPAPSTQARPASLQPSVPADVDLVLAADYVVEGQPQHPYLIHAGASSLGVYEQTVHDGERAVWRSADGPRWSDPSCTTARFPGDHAPPRGRPRAFLRGRGPARDADTGGMAR